MWSSAMDGVKNKVKVVGMGLAEAYITKMFYWTHSLILEIVEKYHDSIEKELFGKVKSKNA